VRSARFSLSPLLLLLSPACIGSADRAPEAPATGSPAASVPTLRLQGALPRPATLTVTDLEAIGGEIVEWTFRDQHHVYRGLRLDHLLTAHGFEPGPGGAAVPPAERRAGWRRVLVASGADGVFAVFTLAELMPEMGPSRAFVVWRRDDQPLPDDEGPLRLVVPTDAKGSRGVRGLIGLEVFDMRAWVRTDTATPPPRRD